MKINFNFFFLILISTASFAQSGKNHNLVFDTLAKTWYQGMPLGNGWLGELIWQKENKLRLSLDRVDLWDLRPMPKIDKLKYSWVVEKVKKNQYDSAQKLGDLPYEQSPAPTKIPGAALEFNLDKIGKVVSNELDISKGINIIRFDNGIVFYNYVHAQNEIGYFIFENLPPSFNEQTIRNLFPELKAPEYGKKSDPGDANSLSGQLLGNLGYKQGTVSKTNRSILYHQPTHLNKFYEVFVQWSKLRDHRLFGEWTIKNNSSAILPEINIQTGKNIPDSSHVQWWNNFWSRSSISIPDSIIERQYYLDMYKFGCVARPNTPPISLQAIWTADNGVLPPWKGDIHNDLNTELSYWPGYASNHLDLTASFTNWLWNTRLENSRWTKSYFHTPGLNVPGVETIEGKPMGGWIQYSMSPTTVFWLSQHFYWQWKYSMDSSFLSQRVKPYFNSAASYLLNIVDPHSFLLPLSTSPEINDNTINAWFKKYTNYDLSLCRYFLTKQIEIGNQDKNKILEHLPQLATDENGLKVSPDFDLTISHRHLSPFMAIYPLCMLDIDRAEDKTIVENSIKRIESLGTGEWCGYSFSWMACVYARAKAADKAARQLQIFATHFVSTNSFHLNGDQQGGPYSKFDYNPFTLEGNFAFAQGVHELLLQNHGETIEVFPAVPAAWKDISFTSLRAEGAFLISAEKRNGVADSVHVYCEHGGQLNIQLPFKTWIVSGIDRKNILTNDGGLSMTTTPGQTIVFRNAYE